jgi:hypothetical protein
VGVKFLIGRLVGGKTYVVWIYMME